jgi:transcriptional regulator with XRE-family HTH domain
VFDKKTVGRILKTARKARGIRQGEMADLVGKTPAALSHIEAGRNAAPFDVLRIYAEHLFGLEHAGLFLECIEKGDESALRKIASLLDPDRSRRVESYLFEKGFDSADQLISRDWKVVTQNTIPRDFRITYLNTTAPSSFDERESTIRSLQALITERGGRFLIAGRDSPDFGTGFSMKCDLVETTRSLVIEVRAANRFESRFVTEMVGKAVLLSRQGFQFVLCFSSPPRSKLDLITVELARSFGAKVIWDTRRSIQPDSASFGGDELFEGERA